MKQFVQILVGLTLAASMAGAIASDHVGRYDFSYGVQADIRVRPIQIFDDGANTYFQFRPMDSLPAIFRVTQDGPVMLTLQVDGPYLRADGVGAEHLIRLGSATGRVTYARPGRFTAISAPAAIDPAMWTARGREGLPLSTAMEARSAVALEANSYATPAKGDKVQWASSQLQLDELAVGFSADSSRISPETSRKLKRLARDLEGDYLVRIIGRDDGNLKEGVDRARAKAIRELLIANGARSNQIKIEVGSPVKDGKVWLSHVIVERREVVAAPKTQIDTPAKNAEAPMGGFKLLATDRTLSGALRRWAASTNYQVAWEIDVDPPLQADGELLASTMHQAMESLAADMRSKSYDVKITIYANRVIRIAYTQAGE